MAIYTGAHPLLKQKSSFDLFSLLYLPNTTIPCLKRTKRFVLFLIGIGCVLEAEVGIVIIADMHLVRCIHSDGGKLTHTSSTIHSSRYP